MRLLYAVEDDFGSIGAVDAFLDLCQRIHANEICAQVQRSDGWMLETNKCKMTSLRLNGKMPLEYFIEQAQMRNLKVHVWVHLGMPHDNAV